MNNLKNYNEFLNENQQEIPEEVFMDFDDLKRRYRKKYLAMSSNARSIKAAKEIASKYKLKYSNILKKFAPDNNIKGDKSWDENGIIYTLHE